MKQNIWKLIDSPTSINNREGRASPISKSLFALLIWNCTASDDSLDRQQVSSVDIKALIVSSPLS